MAKAKKEELSLDEKLEQALVPIDEQPYEIPENWCWLYLGALLTEIKNGTTIKQDKSGEGYNVTRIESLQNQTIDFNRLGTIVDSNTIKETDWYQTGDIAMSHINSAEHVGKTAMITEDMLPLVHGMNLLRLRFYKCCLPQYFQYFTQSYQYKDEILKRINMAVNQVSINQKQVGTLEFPLPPLAEQQRIVEQIESLFVKLDEAKEKIQAVLTGYQSRKTMIIHKAFAGHYTKEWRKRNGCDIRDWKQITLNDVAEYKKGPFGSSITKAMFVPKASNTYKVYEQGNAIRKTLEYGSYYITEEKYKELKGFAVQPGDIIISCAGTIGEVYKLPEDCEAGVINQALMRVRIFDNIDEKFFIYYFGEVLKGDVNEQANGTAIKNIPPFKIMKAMEIKLPTLEEQQEIVAILDKVLESEKQSEDVLYLMIEQIDLMKKSILAKAFRGELDTNNPDEESAVKLLK